MLKHDHKTIFYPDYVAQSILDIHSNELRGLGISHVAFDIDETLVPRRHNELSHQYIHHLQNLEAHGIHLLIASNSSRDLSNITRHLHATLVRPTRLKFKPRRAYYQRLITAAKTQPAHIAMAGDRIMNDIIGANRAGLTSILVKPYARKQTWLYNYYLGCVARTAK